MSKKVYHPEMTFTQFKEESLTKHFWVGQQKITVSPSIW
jgi:hypothetical protein